MHILCLNGWGGKLHDQLLPYLQSTAPDILCLQEVVHTPQTEADWLTYRDGDHILPQRARLYDEVRAALPDHWAMFCPAAQGELWDGETPVPSQWGLATLVSPALTVIGQVQGFVHKDFSPQGYGAHPRSRMAHGVRVYDHRAERVVNVLHMHGLRDLAGKHDTPERRAQAERFAQMASGLAGAGEALVLCGDFNVGRGSETLDILRALGLRELVTEHGYAGTRTHHYTKPERYADYMLVNRPVVEFEVIDSPAVSDHCALSLVL
ncbi:endonuclease/exonuclease/phosphatase family protein [Pararhodobacter oceanensis]|uniref:endonuclease/exonuclease/phosphatase family protein n=1 Tax=Pararhodobacter oceanensis TaxID=2172121 RepID=UPI003A8E8230